MYIGLSLRDLQPDPTGPRIQPGFLSDRVETRLNGPDVPL